MKNGVVDFTAELVRLPSVLGHEDRVAKAVAGKMQSLGFDHVEIDDAGNVIGVINGNSVGPTIVFDGHMDTVDIMPREAWRHDPFGAEIVDGRMYGRGTSDMKGAVAAMVCGAAAVDRSRMRGRIVVSASVGEEWVEGAALRHVLQRYPADFVVIGEASELDIIRGGRGRAEFVIATHGKPAHASTPSLGINAVHKMLDVVREIEALPMPKDDFVGHGLMALTDIISNPYPAHSVVPSGCRATYERRLLPGETKNDVFAQLHSACERAGASDTTIELAMLDYKSYTGIEWRQPKWFPAWVVPEDAFIVEAAHAALGSIGLSPKVRSYQFCTNAAYSAGEAGIPTIGLGPSREAFAHITDEYIEVAELTKAVDVYRAVAEHVLRR